MKYTPHHYAKAFASVVAHAPAAARDGMIRRFLRSVRKNGDFSRLGQIVSAIERRFVADRGGAWVRLEFARPQTERAIASLERRFGTRDHVEVSVRPELIAGVRITRNGEIELDYSFARKLKKLFSHKSLGH